MNTNLIVIVVLVVFTLYCSAWIMYWSYNPPHHPQLGVVVQTAPYNWDPQISDIQLLLGTMRQSLQTQDCVAANEVGVPLRIILTSQRFYVNPSILQDNPLQVRYLGEYLGVHNHTLLKKEAECFRLAYTSFGF